MNIKCHPPPQILCIVFLLLFLTGSAAALLNRFSFIPSPFCSTLLNDPCQQVDHSLEQNKIKLIFPVVLNLFYNIKATGLFLSWSSKGCTGTWVEPWQLRLSKTRQGCRLAGLRAFTPARKRPGNFPWRAFSHAALTGAEAVLQMEENTALNTETGAGDGKGLLGHSVHFSAKADLSSAFPSICPLHFLVLLQSWFFSKWQESSILSSH